MKIYIAAPLFNDMEKQRNLEIDEFVRSIGFETYLPQRDGGELVKLTKDAEDKEKVRRMIFERDFSEVKECFLLLFLLDGRVPDEGACFELGIAYALGKHCIGYQTDVRNFANGHNNLMLDMALTSIARNLDELNIELQKFKKG